MQPNAQFLYLSIRRRLSRQEENMTEKEQEKKRRDVAGKEKKQ